MFCVGECGRAEEDPDAAAKIAAAAAALEEKNDEATRIVNGWKAKPRPFMALIRAVSRQG